MIAFAQDWRRELAALPEHPTANAQEIDRFVQNVQLATPYFATITPGDYEANREMVRRMWAYTMALDMMAKQNPMLRSYAVRARRAMNAFPIGYSMIQTGRPAEAPAPAAQTKPGDPPFALTAPDGALGERYESTAVRAASAWRNADKMRQDLALRGLSLNPATAAAVGRLEADMDAAMRNIKSGKQNEASAALDRADAEIEKISKILGR